MNKNMGTVDRIVRIAIGVAIAAAGIWFQSWWGLLAIVPLGTAAIGTCPLYLPFGISTKKKA